MQNLMNAQNITLSGAEMIDSQQLLVMVNETRKEHGEATIRNNVFIDRIKARVSRRQINKLFLSSI